MRKIWKWIVPVLVFSTITFGYFVYRVKTEQKHVQSASKQVITEQKPIESKWKDAGNGLVWYEIPEMGIRMKVKKTFAEDLKYSYDKDEKYPSFTLKDKEYIIPYRETVLFMTQSLGDTDPNCRDAVIKDWTKELGMANDWGFMYLSYSVPIRQFDTFFIVDTTVWRRDTDCYLADGGTHPNRVSMELFANQTGLLADSFETIEKLPQQ